MNLSILALLLALLSTGVSSAAEPYQPPALSRDSSARFEFRGLVGERIEANVRNWLIPAPDANPGMLEMFAVRDRQPVPNLVPWVGEFVGKYLISAVQALRMSNDPQLKQVVSSVVERLIKSQAEDGYLGPFRKHERLLGHWDLWGHYHCILGLLTWHELTGDRAALASARRAGDLVCNTFLDTGKRALDAKSDEMNLSIIHALGWLYRLTGEERYWRMMREIVKDWESVGDYFRTGLKGIEFYQSPRPRWESLHNLQGLVELHAIEQDDQYRRAFEHHWRSIARFDLRNTGGFSSGEQATGNPYSPTPIETCCSIAWMALSTDMLRLSGDSRVADLLELATLNAWAGAQHPSGRWCTYSTPMDGTREASAHAIVFQSRHGTPELNCCSVNGPRGWGMLVDWALMKSTNGIVLNWLGSATYETTQSARKLSLEVVGNYPIEPKVQITINSTPGSEYPIQIRIPEWSKQTTVSVNRNLPVAAKAGEYFTLKRQWQKSDSITLNLDLATRAVPGDREALGKISLYRGPLLLAYDQKYNPYDPAALPEVRLEDLLAAKPVQLRDPVPFTPWILLEAGAGLKSVRLCDFASAGAHGTHYRSWLETSADLPPTVVTRQPADAAAIPPGDVAFRWTGPLKFDGDYILQISDTDDFSRPLLEIRNLTARETLLRIDARFQPGAWYHWQVLAAKPHHKIPSAKPVARFQVDTNLPPAAETLQPPRKTGPEGELISASLHGNPEPSFGDWRPTPNWTSAPAPDGTADDAIALNGLDQRLIYKVGPWPEEDYTLSLKFKVNEFPTNRLGQIFSAWAAGMDDPLRVCVQDGRLFARIEAGNGYSTPGVPIEPNRWYDLRLTKRGTRLLLFLDGQERASTTVPEYISTRATDFALGGNPHYPGHEFLALGLRDLKFFPEAKD